MFYPGKRTLHNLEGVHPLIVRAVMKAFEYTTVDFCVLDGGGLRSKRQAQQNAARGTGVVNSMHCAQSDGFAHAVDLVAYEGGPKWPKTRAECDRLYGPIHDAMFRACDEVGILIQNGADWDNDGVKGEKKEFDWPHFQFPRFETSRRQAMEARDRRAKAMVKD